MLAIKKNKLAVISMHMSSSCEKTTHKVSSIYARTEHLVLSLLYDLFFKLFSYETWEEYPLNFVWI
jgi:hypothetical protein